MNDAKVYLVIIVRGHNTSLKSPGKTEETRKNDYVNTELNEYIGIGYIKAYLEEKGIPVDIHAIYTDDIDKIARIIDETTAVTGFGFYIDIANDVLKAAKILKTKFPHMKIVLGGPHVKNFSKTILEENTAIDYVISGEGEYTFHYLIEKLFQKEEIQESPGLSFRDLKGNIVVNKYNSPITDLDKLPFPSRDIYEKIRQDYFYISGGRGCLGACSFCGEPADKAGLKPKEYVRNRSPGNIVDEMEHLIKKYGVNRFRFTDATFEDPGESGKKKAEGIFDEIIKRNLKVSLHTFSRSELITESSREYLKKGYKAGLECIYLGVESGNDSDLRLYNKKAGMEDNLRAIAIIKEEGIFPAFGFICFNPYSTHESLLQNAGFLYNSGLGHVFYLYQTRLAVLPQTAISRRMIRDGLLSLEMDYKTHFHDYNFLDPKIGMLYKIMKKIYPKTYYVDTSLEMDRIWSKKNLEGSKKEIDTMFSKVDIIREQLNKLNYTVFSQCVEMSMSGKPIDKIEQYCNKHPIDQYHKEYVDLYEKISDTTAKYKSGLF